MLGSNLHVFCDSVLNYAELMGFFFNHSFDHFLFYLSRFEFRPRYCFWPGCGLLLAVTSMLLLKGTRKEGKVASFATGKGLT